MDASSCAVCCSSSRQDSPKPLSCAARRRRISYEKAMETNLSASPEVVRFGPMVIKNPKKLALFISVAQDKYCREMQNQLSSFQWDVKKASSVDQVSEYFNNRNPNLVVLDARNKLKNWDPLFIIRSMQEMNQKSLDGFVVVALIEKSFSQQERITRSLKNTGVCQVLCGASQLVDFLLLFDRSILPLQIRLRACQALFSALDQSETAIEITDDNRYVQYVNQSYESVTGCLRADVLGTLSSDLRRKSLPHRRISLAKDRKSHLFDSLEKRTSFSSKSIDWHCFPVPTFSPNHPQEQYVYYRPVMGEEQAKHFSEARRHQQMEGRAHRSSNGPIALEAPFTEILSLLSDAQQKSEDTQDDKLHKSIKEAMKILSSADVYTGAPAVKSHFKDEDKVSSDLFDGLIMNGPNRSQQQSRKMSLSDAMRESHSFSKLGHFTSTRSMSPDIRGLLDKVSQWNFSIFDLEKATFKRPLVHLGMKIFEKWKVPEFLECSESCIRSWLEAIESHYRAENPYHNAVHAADVLQSTACFLGQESVANAIDHTDAVAALLAAVIHDVDHPGKGSAFLIHTRHSLAMLYNDVSVLENHHSAFAFRLCFSDSRINIFSRLSRQDYGALRKSIVDMVLATDMNRHFDYLAQFQQTVLSSMDGEIAVPTVSPKQSVCRILIKCADINNPTRSWELCKEWAYRIVEEYFNQTAEERAKGLPLTMEVFDRESCNVPLTQSRFIDMFARDLFDGWCGFAEMPELVDNLELNYGAWQEEAVVWPQQRKQEFTRFGRLSSESVNAPSVILECSVDEAIAETPLLAHQS